MRFRKQWRCGAAVVLLVIMVARPAAADDVETLIRHGVELRKKGQDREALAEFQKAAAIRETPRVLAQIGLAEYALGLWLPAEEHLTSALKQDSDPWVRHNRAALTEAASGVSAHLGTLEVWGEPEGAEVLVNGKLAGKFPSPPAVRVVAGACSLVVRADGFEETSRTLRVTAGELVRENVQLAPTPSPRPRLAASAPEPAGSAHPTIAAAPAAPGTTSEESGGVTRKWWFWTAIGAVVVGGVVAALVLTRPDGGVSCPRGVECPQ